MGFSSSLQSPKEKPGVPDGGTIPPGPPCPYECLFTIMAGLALIDSIIHLLNIRSYVEIMKLFRFFTMFWRKRLA